MKLLASFEWSVIWDNRGALLHGLKLDVEASLIAIAGATTIGIVLGAVRANRIPFASQLAGVYVEIIRCTPFLGFLLLFFYGLPEISRHFLFSGFTAACVVLMLWGGAFNTENFRAGFEAVPYRYREAGLALGFGRIATFFRVTLPIGGRIALPSTINTHVSILKNTTLLTAIGLQELTTTSRSISASNFRDVEMLSTVAVVYLALVWSLSALVRLLERRLRVVGA